MVTYGLWMCGIWSSSKEHFGKLDQIHFRALRLSIGAAQTMPMNALLVEADEPPLHLRRTKWSLAY